MSEEYRYPKTVRYEMQMDEDTHNLAERAARISGLPSIKAYLIQLISKHAPETLREYSNVRLSDEQFEAFCKACDDPPELSDKLQTAAKLLDQYELVTIERQ